MIHEIFYMSVYLLLYFEYLHLFVSIPHSISTSSSSLSLFYPINKLGIIKINLLTMFPLKRKPFYLHNFLIVCIPVKESKMKGCIFVLQGHIFAVHLFISKLFQIFNIKKKLIILQLILKYLHQPL